MHGRIMTSPEPKRVRRILEGDLIYSGTTLEKDPNMVSKRKHNNPEDTKDMEVTMLTTSPGEAQIRVNSARDRFPTIWGQLLDNPETHGLTI